MSKANWVYAVVAATLCAACAGETSSPYYAQCAAEVQVPESAWQLGTVKRELLNMCIQSKVAAASKP